MLIAQLCLTCDPMVCSLPDYSVHGIPYLLMQHGQKPKQKSILQQETETSVMQILNIACNLKQL